MLIRWWRFSNLLFSFLHTLAHPLLAHQQTRFVAPYAKPLTVPLPPAQNSYIFCADITEAAIDPTTQQSKTSEEDPKCQWTTSRYPVKMSLLNLRYYYNSACFFFEVGFYQYIVIKCISWLINNNNFLQAKFHATIFINFELIWMWRHLKCLSHYNVVFRKRKHCKHSN